MKNITNHCKYDWSKDKKGEEYSINDSSSLSAIIEAFVKSTIAASALIPARSDSVSIELSPPVVAVLGAVKPRFSFLRKLSDKDIVAEKTNVCRFFRWTLGIVLHRELESAEVLDVGSMSMIDCNSWKWPCSIIRSASSSTKKDSECNCNGNMSSN